MEFQWITNQLLADGCTSIVNIIGVSFFSLLSWGTAIGCKQFVVWMRSESALALILLFITKLNTFIGHSAFAH